MTTRRQFVAGLAGAAGGLAVLGARLARAEARGGPRAVRGYGALARSADAALALPRGFSARVVSRVGDPMDDGLVVPGQPDGMAAFAGPGGRSVLLRNHEVPPGDEATAFRYLSAPLGEARLARIYDPAAGRGGVTTLVYDTASARLERQFLCLAGALRNCAGGPTPWGSWITCEEITIRKGELGAARDHGYNFEVPADAGGLVAALPLVEMGRFNHEAVAVLNAAGVTYQTEDQPDGLLYRFLPSRAGSLAAGGRLQALALRDAPGAHTGNDPGAGSAFPVATPMPVDWVNLDDVTAPADDLRHRGRSRGAAAFARGEGICVARRAHSADSRVWFACTTGGRLGRGQLWRYRPSRYEGSAREREAPGTLELFLEPENIALLNRADNVAIAPSGDVVVCEDNRELPRLLGVTSSGDVYVIAANPARDAEFAGATFSPDGSTLFVNLQQRGVTLAISGAWRERASSDPV